MALSDHEQKLFEQLERELREDDPSFASSIDGDSSQQSNAQQIPGTQFSIQKIVIGAVIALAGLGVIILGVSLKMIAVGVLGFLLAAAGVYWATSADKKSKTNPNVSQQAKAPTRNSKSSSGFMKGLEDRWDNRQGGSY